MDINQLLALVEDVVCRQKPGQGFWEEAGQRGSPLTLALGSAQNTRNVKPVGPSNAWKDRAYRQCLYLQLEHMEQELLLVGTQGFSQCQSHAQALRQLQTLKDCLREQPGTLNLEHTR
uniref:Uncharacterized protein n=1 Tax=Catagonus wagneri TaxID=51154 RepID=A0A8C3VPL1_9CETA